MARGGSKPQPTITPDSALGGTEIERSLRFQRGDSAYLSRSVGTTGNRRTFTISFWAKFCDPQAAAAQRLFSTDGGNGNGDIFKIEFYGGAYAPRQLAFLDNNHSGSGIRFTVNRNIRDATSWYHVVFSVDTTQGTASDRVKIYINGEQETEFLSGSEHNHQPDQNYDTCVNLSGKTTTWGRSFAFGSSSAVYSDMYLAEAHLIDGYQYDASYFGFTDPQTGIWMPKRYEGTYGTNGYRLDFSDNTSTTTLGIDKSPNGNDFSLNNLELNDSVPDTPTNNWCTLNPLNSFGGTSPTVTNGNLNFNLESNAHYPLSTFLIPKTGKWYSEVLFTADGIGQAEVKVTNPELSQNSSGASATNRHNGINYYGTDIRVDDNNNLQTGVTAIGVNNVIGICIDRDNDTVLYKNNNSNVGYAVTLADSAGSTETLTIGVGRGSNSGSNITGKMNFGQDSSFSGSKTAQNKTDASGLGDFYYEPPAEHRALCAKNIAETSSPTVRPQKHFGTLLYTGNGSSGHTISGLEFQPDFAWVKRRDSGANHGIYDVVTGVTSYLRADLDNAQDSNLSHLSSFNKDGFTLGADTYQNTNSATYVAWCWKAGGTAVTNNDGSITSSVSANVEAGFSIVAWTGTGSDGTIGHGLGKAPSIYFVKRRNSSKDWYVQIGNINDISLGRFLKLNESNTIDFASDVFAATADTSTVLNTKGDSATNGSGDTYVAYCWAEIPGYSKFGQWTGNGSSSAPFVYTGFRPAFLLYKATNGAHDWRIFDTTRDVNNGVNTRLRPNTSDAEDTHGGMDILSNGFKIRNGVSGNNGGGETHIFMAFAEQPGKTPFSTFANAR